MSLNRSAVLYFSIIASVAMVGQQAFGQGATPYTTFAVNPNLQPLDPELVASDEVAKAKDAERARARSAANISARKVLAGQIPFDDAGKSLLDAWYIGYYLPSFTLPETLGSLPEWRDTLLNKELRPAKSAAAVAYVRGWVMTYMKGYAQSKPPKNNFHPAVRYNAMLVIGALNAVEQGARVNEQKALVPEPLPEALDLLISEYKSPTQIDAVRVAALVGIDRHVKLDLAKPKIPGTKKRIIVDDMIALLNSAPPAGRTAEGHTWMQRRAVDILAAFGMVGAYPNANAALEQIVANKDAPISLRCTASEALAQWAPTSKEKIDAGTVSHNLGMIAVKACKEELDRIAALERYEKDLKDLRELIKKPNPVASGEFGTMAGGGTDPGMMMSEGYAGMMGGGGEEMTGGPDMESMYGGAGGMGMYGPMVGGKAAEIPTDPRVIWSRRRLKYQLTCVKRGLDGMTVAGKASQDEKDVERIKAAVEAALALTDPPAEKPTLEGMSESIRKGVLGLAFLAPEVAEIAAEPVTELPSEIDPATPAAPATVDPTAPDPAAAALPAADPAAAAADPAAAVPVAPAAPAAVDALGDPAAPPALPPGLE